MDNSLVLPFRKFLLHQHLSPSIKRIISITPTHDLPNSICSSFLRVVTSALLGRSLASSDLHATFPVRENPTPQCRLTRAMRVACELLRR
ncbi:hypothetical protein M758_2G036400 [Ceratodon purpureus]|nr:hypothetical protein M758_2G036400 [Ceratodon purpureus]